MDRRVALFAGAQLAAFWPVWSWYAGRLRDGSEIAGVAAALVAAAATPGRPKVAATPPGLLPAAAATLAYVVAFPWSPPLGRALLALLATGLLWTWRGPRAEALPRVGLLLLAAPVVPSLQFYLGFPLRAIVSTLAAGWLRLAGLAVSPRGAGLAFDGRVILVDAPCSGVAMLWGMLFLALVAALLHGLGTLRVVALLAAATLLSVGANGLRAAGLFYKEAGLVAVPDWTHDAAGLCVFAATGVLIVGLAARLGRSRCAT